MIGIFAFFHFVMLVCALWFALTIARSLFWIGLAFTIIVVMSSGSHHP